MPEVVDPERAKLKAAAKFLAIQEFWRRGDLYFKLHVTQRKIYEAMKAAEARGTKRHFLCCSRRLGKTFMLVCLAFEVALQRPRARILYLAPFGKDAVRIVRDTVDHLIPDCPDSVRPEWKTQDREFVFKNGSIIRFAGVNGERAEFLRGGEADLVILDECGTMDNLDEVVDNVVTPMTLTTKGVVIMATTPAKSPAHESKRFADDAFRDGCGYEFNLLAAPHIDYETKTLALRSCGEKTEEIPKILAGMQEPRTTKALREYWCKWVTDAGSAYVPEFDAAAKAEIIRTWVRVPYFDAYVAMDPGSIDNTGILFAHWDSKAGRIVIEDEWLARHAGTGDIAKAIQERETLLWGNQRPYMRISDIELRLIGDLVKDYGLAFTPTLKRDSKGAVWNMRQMVANRSLVIQPNCVNLIRQLETATWNKRASDLADEIIKNEEGELEDPAHFDLVAALKYLCRMVNKQHNPWPGWANERVVDGRRVAKQKRLFKSLRIVETPASRRLEKVGK